MSDIHIDLSNNEDFGTSVAVDMCEMTCIQKPRFICHKQEMSRLAVNASWYIPGVVFGSTACCLDILLIGFGQMRVIGMEILRIK